MAAAQYREAGWAAICRAAARVWRCGSGRLGIHSGARGGHLVAQRSREGAAMAGVGHGAGAARPCVRHGGERKRGREKRYGLTAGARVAVKQEVGDGPVVWWAEKGKAGCGVVKGRKASGWPKGLRVLS
jgi:hypothetical protein